MRGRKRFLLALLCLALLLTVLPLSALAAEEGSIYQTVIEDGADLLTQEQEEELQRVMDQVLPFGNAAFVSTASNPTTAEQYAEQKFLEFFGDTSGALLLIDMDNRYIQLIADGEVYKTVTRRRCNEITDNCYTYASKGDYAGCANRAFLQVVRLLEGGRVAAPFRYVTNALLALYNTKMKKLTIWLSLALALCLALGAAAPAFAQSAEDILAGKEFTNVYKSYFST